MEVDAASDVATPLSALLTIMAEGECIARDCARAQARAADDARARRFFGAQAMHETFHAYLFLRAARHLAPKTRVMASHRRGLQRYARQLDTATVSGHWNEVVIGQQLVLENLGELVLLRLDGEMDRRRIGFKRTRSLVLRQERAHHHFGTQWIEHRLRVGQMCVAEARDIAGRYIALADGILDDVSDLLEALDADADAYRREVRGRLPAWTRSRSL